MKLADLPVHLPALAPVRLILWPALGGVGATIVLVLREGHRRTALNECLHELRRPLQALVLSAHRGEAGQGQGDGAVEMTAAALARLEREINGRGGEPIGPRETFAARPLLEAARRRWRDQARLRGKSLGLRWDADEAALIGDRVALAAALDNLLANALEHGGERIELAADRCGERICLGVVDSGGGAGRRSARHSPLVDLSGRARRGHGLRLVRRTAAHHDGAFALHQGEHGTSAVLELPVARSRWAEPSPFAEASLEEPAARRAEIIIRKGSR